MAAMTAALVVICLSACQATIRVGVDVRANGAGTVSVTVSLDHDAAAAVPDLASTVSTADLRQAGWQIVGPSPVSGGGVTMVASKGFRTPAEAAEVLGELSGPTGPFHDLHLARSSSLFKTTTSLTGTVDLTCGLACFGDPQLQQALGANLGLDPAKLQQAGIDPAQLVTFAVAVSLPGAVQSSNAPVRTGRQSVWPIPLGTRASLATSSRVVHHDRLLEAEIGIAAVVVVAIGVVLWWVLRRRRRRRARRSQREGRGPLHAARR